MLEAVKHQNIPEEKNCLNQIRLFLEPPTLLLIPGFRSLTSIEELLIVHNGLGDT